MLGGEEGPLKGFYGAEPFLVLSMTLGQMCMFMVVERNGCQPHEGLSDSYLMYVASLSWLMWTMANALPLGNQKINRIKKHVLLNPTEHSFVHHSWQMALEASVGLYYALWSFTMAHVYEQMKYWREFHRKTQQDIKLILKKQEWIIILYNPGIMNESPSSWWQTKPVIMSDTTSGLHVNTPHQHHSTHLVFITLSKRIPLLFHTASQTQWHSCSGVQATSPYHQHYPPQCLLQKAARSPTASHRTRHLHKNTDK